MAPSWGCPARQHITWKFERVQQPVRGPFCIGEAMYWLVLSTFFWSATYGQYGTEVECREAAKHEPWYVSARCIPVPEPKDHQH